MPTIDTSRNVSLSDIIETLTDNGFCQCERCEAIETENDALTVVITPGNNRNQETQLWCEDCADSHGSCCDCCGNHTDDNEIVTDNHTRVCTYCYENNYFTCENCTDITHIDGSYCHNENTGETFCECCARSNWTIDSDGNWTDETETETELEESMPTSANVNLREYTIGAGLAGYHGDTIRRNWGIPVGAITLELELKTPNRNAVANRLRDKYNIACERDGSLCDAQGMECIFPPDSFEHTKKRVQTVLSELRQFGAIAWKAGTGYGIHVNLDCRNWSDTKVGAYCNQFGEVNRTWLEKIAGRKENHWASYKATDDEIDVPTAKYSAAAPKSGGRLEVRIFRATLKTETAIGYLAICKDIERYIDCDLFRKPSGLLGWLIRNGSDETKQLLTDKVGLTIPETVDYCSLA